MHEPLPLIARAHARRSRPALIAATGERVSYAELLGRSAAAATVLLDGASDLAGARVAFMLPPSIGYVVCQWGTFRAGGVAVPLCTTHPAPELAHVIDDSGATTLVADAEHAPMLEPLARARGLRFVRVEALLDAGVGPLPRVGAERDAMLVYTSGTTGKPKGAVSSHASFAAQLDSVTRAWEWTERDRILNVLPWHHLHGILNVLGSALYSGACCEIEPRFDPERVWRRLCEAGSADADSDAAALSLFMAVPTIYARLITHHDAASEPERAAFMAGCRALRLMVSGSAALPVSVLERWRAISGHTLLERYGMTEIGMALGNPLHGERRAGQVGVPFPGMDVELRGDDGAPVADGVPGQIHVRGPGVFVRYWQRPEETAASFSADGWFKTGDTAIAEAGVHRILGRNSVDILKTGGYKVSALEIEDVLRDHPAIAEVAVVGLADPEWGQRVAAAVILKAGATLELEALRSWAKQRLAPYKVPSVLKCLAELPRNAMGKALKPEIGRLFDAGG
jgi:malonyl-CoA/methylmalonyl-CoA synthetase